MTAVYLTHVKSYDNRDRDDFYMSKSLDSAIDWCIKGLLDGDFDGFVYNGDDIYDDFSVKNEEEFIEFVKSELTNCKYLSNDVGSINITEEILHD